MLKQIDVISDFGLDPGHNPDIHNDTFSSKKDYRTVRNQ